MILNLPYTALRAFEAVARQGSFSAAADELGVSQSAVSQHVKSLEDWLGHDLMTRGARRSAPTPEGARLAQAITLGLGRISEVCDDIRSTRRASSTIVISCLPGFAFIWLFPRLMNFDLAHPDLAISIATDTGFSDLSRARAQIGIRYGDGSNPGFEVEPLMAEDLVPVCAPALLRDGPPLRDVTDLALHTRLEDQFSPQISDPPSWEYWASENDLTLPAPARSRSFGQTNLVVQAAIQGGGVALGRSPLVGDALADGRLVRPLPQIARSRLGYWLVYATAQRDNPAARLFIDWIKAEAAIQPDLPGIFPQQG